MTATTHEQDANLFDDWTHDYARLSLRLDRLTPGTVDAWTGPPAWREQILREPLPTAEALHAAASALLDRLPAVKYAPRRTAYLVRQVTALEASARLLEGEEIGLIEQARLFFDIEVERVPEDQFAKAHQEMARILPGPGTLAERMAARRKQLEVRPEQITDMLERIVDELRKRTAQYISLPAGERIDLAFVQNQPWGGYNWYLGDAHSRIELNTDLPLHVHDLVDYMAHEGYPGHHTEHALREIRQFRGEGQGEFAVQLINTPECVVSEGIATSACSMVFPNDEEIAWTAAELLPALGMTMDVEEMVALKRARWMLRGVRGNAAIMLHEDGKTKDEVIDYLENWALLTPEEALKALEFIASPLWRTYTFTYTYGRDLLQPLLQGDDRFVVFERISSEPVYPTLLKDWAG
ncbi:MAG: hypothetical protein JWO59_1203 [Chloroflexi bacterium]|nr:hypothetical protein [Chloroflexota bacterium]